MRVYLTAVIKPDSNTYLLLDVLDHLGANLADLGGLCVASLLHLVLSLGGESNAEQTKEVSVGGLDGAVGFNHGLKLYLFK